MSNSHTLLRFLRKLHLYIGVFIAPALLFFALTGALQTLSLHEGSSGSSYKAPSWIATLAQIHKNQTDVVRKRPQPAVAKPGGPSQPDAGTPHTPGVDAAAAAPAEPLPTLPTDKWKMHLPLKIFFLLIAVGLFVSTLTGIYMSYKFSRGKVVITALLLAGIVTPLILLKF